VACILTKEHVRRSCKITIQLAPPIRLTYRNSMEAAARSEAPESMTGRIWICIDPRLWKMRATSSCYPRFPIPQHMQLRHLGRRVGSSHMATNQSKWLAGCDKALWIWSTLTVPFWDVKAVGRSASKARCGAVPSGLDMHINLFADSATRNGCDH